MFRPSAVVLLLWLLGSFASHAQKGEKPPYDPTPASVDLRTYTNAELGLTIAYPTEFVPGTAQDLLAVMRKGHQHLYGAAPDSDPEHEQAERCMHSLLYATSSNPDHPSAAYQDSIMVFDVEASCLPRSLEGDKALTQLAGTMLNLPGAQQLVPQMWFVAGGKRRIHSGMAQLKLGSDPADPPAEITLAAAVEQNGHRLLIVSLVAADAQQHPTMQHMTASFDGDRPVLLFPFLLSNVDLKK